MDHDRIKAFNIDFNWDALCRPASPGLYAHASAADHIAWHRDLGANTIQTFCVTYNGFAWYPSEVAPVTPGLPGNFLQEQVVLGHAAGLRVMGYFCLGSNPHWETWCAPKEVHRTGGMPIVLTERYLDYFCASVRDCLLKTGIDGFMIDWINRTGHDEWLPCERTMWRQLMGEDFPAAGTPPEAEVLEFDRRAITRAWTSIRQTVLGSRRVLIWTNHPFRKADDPLWNGHPLLQEVDWVLNEAPKPELLAWLTVQIGPGTRIIQNLCGWSDHDADSAITALDPARFGLYGFAAAHPGTTLPWTLEQAEAYDRHISPEKIPPAHRANALNIPKIRRHYRGT